MSQPGNEHVYAMRELADVLSRGGIPTAVRQETLGKPYQLEVIRGPLCVRARWPRRMIPGVELIEAYREARREAGEKIPCALILVNPPGRGVREHIAAVPLSALLDLLDRAGLV